MERAKNPGYYLLALSIFCMAGAVIYFSYELARIGAQIPLILSTVDQTSEKIGPVLKEVDSVQKQIPDIVKEIDEIRKLIPPVLTEVAEVRRQMPAILQEVEKTRESIPPILQESAEIRKQIPPVLKESAEIRKQIPPILAEVKQTRESIPGTLQEVQRLVDSARTAGKEASKGAVTGVITGIITAPFAIVGNIGKKLGLSDDELKNYSDKDIELLGNAINQVLMSDKIGATQSWENDQNNVVGTVTLKSIVVSDGRQCKIVHITGKKGNAVVTDVDKKICQTPDGKWDVSARTK